MTAEELKKQKAEKAAADRVYYLKMVEYHKRGNLSFTPKGE